MNLQGLLASALLVIHLRQECFGSEIHEQRRNESCPGRQPVENDCTSLVLDYRNKIKDVKQALDKKDSHLCSTPVENKWTVTKGRFHGFIKNIQFTIYRLKDGPMKRLLQVFASVQEAKFKKEEIYQPQIDSIEKSINCLRTIIAAAKKEIKLFLFQFEKFHKDGSATELIELSLKLYYFKKNMEKVELIHVPHVLKQVQYHSGQMIDHYLKINHHQDSETKVSLLQEKKANRLMQQYTGVVNYLDNAYYGISSLQEIIEQSDKLTWSSDCHQLDIDLFVIYLGLLQDGKLLTEIPYIVSLLQLAKHSTKPEKAKLASFLEAAMPNSTDIEQLDREIGKVVAQAELDRFLSPKGKDVLTDPSRGRQLDIFLKSFKNNDSMRALSDSASGCTSPVESSDEVNMKNLNLLKKFKAKLVKISQKVKALIRVTRMAIVADETNQETSKFNRLIQKMTLQQQKLLLVVSNFNKQIDHFVENPVKNDYEPVIGFWMKAKLDLCRLVDYRQFVDILLGSNTSTLHSDLGKTVVRIRDATDVADIQNSVDSLDRHSGSDSTKTTRNAGNWSEESSQDTSKCEPTDERQMTEDANNDTLILTSGRKQLQPFVIKRPMFKIKSKWNFLNIEKKEGRNATKIVHQQEK